MDENLKKIYAVSKLGAHLREEDHVYLLPDGREITKSVSDIVEEEYPFDAETIAERLVNYNPDYEGMSVDDVLWKWDDARDHGTQVHEEIASYIQDGKPPSETKARKACKWLDACVTHYGKRFVVFPEIIVYHKEKNIAGSVDLLVAETMDTRGCVLIDWKTANKLDSRKIKKYSLQLHLYSYLLEHHGIKITRCCIAHLTDDGVDLKTARRDQATTAKQLIEGLRD